MFTWASPYHDAKSQRVSAAPLIGLLRGVSLAVDMLGPGVRRRKDVPWRQLPRDAEWVCIQGEAILGQWHLGLLFGKPAEF